jgi:probable blue pigment (indigoidine) exporter
VLSRKWMSGATPLAFTAWQLTAGGLILMPVALSIEPALPAWQIGHLGALAYLGLIGAALTYCLWFRGLERLGPTTLSLLALLSPVTAVGIGWALLDQTLSAMQVLGVLVVLTSVGIGQQAAAPRPVPPRHARGA